jgi:long-chain fatty acid transport protein
MRGWKMVPVLLFLLFTASTSFAAGFRLPEAGAKAMGMGFAFTAQADDPSAIYFNPAGLTQLKGQNVMVGVTYVRENGAEFTGTTPVDNNVPGPGFTNQKSETQKSLNFYIPNAYYTRTTNSGNIAYGVGIFSPFGLGQEYNDRNTSIFRNQITKIDLKTVVVNPTIAFKVNEFLSVGAGIDWMWGQAKLAETPWSPALVPVVPAFNGNVYNLDLKGDGDAWGYNFGLLLKPTENFRIGANYRSPFTLKIKDGDVNLSNINPAVQAAFGGSSSFSTKAGATVKMPATFALGAAYTVGRVTVEADADWTFWHSFDSLPITFANPVPGPGGTFLLPPTSTNPKGWEDVVAIRLGAEYRVTDPLALRVGFVYDPTPVPAATMGPELPDSTRLNYMAGAGYKVGPWTIDGAFMYIQKFDRTVNNQAFTAAGGTGFNGTWSSNAWLAGLDVGYKF